jgi:hypothetical protein
MVMTLLGHGKTIELDQEVGVPDGQKVEIAIEVMGTAPGRGVRAYVAVPARWPVFPDSTRTWN